MTIFVDADAFPNVLKEILLRFVMKRGIPTRFIANKKISVPDVPFISMEIAPQGADFWISSFIASKFCDLPV